MPSLLCCSGSRLCGTRRHCPSEPPLSTCCPSRRPRVHLLPFPPPPPSTCCPSRRRRHIDSQLHLNFQGSAVCAVAATAYGATFLHKPDRNWGFSVRVCVCVCAPVALVMKPYRLMGKKIGMEWSESSVCRAAGKTARRVPLPLAAAALGVPCGRPACPQSPRLLSDAAFPGSRGTKRTEQEPAAGAPGLARLPTRGGAEGSRPAPGAAREEPDGPLPGRLRPLAVPRQAPGEGQGLPLTCRQPASAKGSRQHLVTAGPATLGACARGREPVTPRDPPRQAPSLQDDDGTAHLRTCPQDEMRSLV